MTKIEEALLQNGEEYRALLNLRQVHSNQHLIEWVLRYDIKHIPCVVDEEAFIELRNKANEIIELATKCYQEISDGHDVIETAFENNRGKRRELQTVRDVFKL